MAFCGCYFCADVHENVISKGFRKMILKAICMKEFMAEGNSLSAIVIAKEASQKTVFVICEAEAQLSKTVI